MEPILASVRQSKLAAPHEFSRSVMTGPKIAALAIFALALTCGQILFKAAAQSIKGPIGLDFQTLLQLALNPFLLLGLGIYALAALYWVLLLREIELSKAYLSIALVLVLVPLAGTILFREPFTARLFVGIVIIIFGLTVAFW
jgi:undecaprenyl phosphate-alpha-L-ara4N flippase subunit ArnE